MANAVDQLFTTSSPTVKENYDSIMEEVKKFGPLTVEPKKTSIHINNTSAFLGVHPKKHWLDLNIVTTEPIKSERIRKVEQVSKNRFHNEVRIEEAEEVDDELISWLQESYALKS